MEAGLPDESSAAVRAPAAGQTALFFMVSLLVGIIAFRPLLNLFPWYDDLAIFSHLHPGLGNSFLKIFQPLPNGVWRPLDNVLIYSVLALFGIKPLAVHGTALLIHCAAATSVWVASQVLLGFKRPWAWACGLLFLVHAGNYGVILFLANACDSLMTIAFMLSLIAWDRWLSNPSPKKAALVVGGFVFALMAKESAVVLPLILGLWAFSRGVSREGRVWKFIGLLLIGSLVFGLLILYSQSQFASYANEHRLTRNPVNIVLRHGSLLASAAVPYFTVLALPNSDDMLPVLALWEVLIISLIVVISSLVALLAGKTRRPIPLFLILAASVSLIMPSLITDPIEARFLHTPIAFLTLAFVAMAQDVKKRPRLAARVMIGVLWLSLLPGLYLSNTIKWHQWVANTMKVFTQAIIRESSDWPNNAEIAVFNHPHSMGTADDLAYSQEFFNVFVPEKNATLVLDEVTSRTEVVYEFRDQQLRRREQ